MVNSFNNNCFIFLHPKKRKEEKYIFERKDKKWLILTLKTNTGEF